MLSLNEGPKAACPDPRPSPSTVTFLGENCASGTSRGGRSWCAKACETPQLPSKGEAALAFKLLDERLMRTPLPNQKGNDGQDHQWTLARVQSRHAVPRCVDSLRRCHIPPKASLAFHRKILTLHPTGTPAPRMTNIIIRNPREK